MNRNDFVTDMINSAIESLLWSELDDTGEPMDTNYDESDLDQEVIDELSSDLEGFFDENWQILHDQRPGQVGHDFIMTRNGHGCGFWDGDYPEAIGARLTDSAKVYGTLGLYVGDDGVLYPHN